jgi:phosphorylcholine metabolism protein LicD
MDTKIALNNLDIISKILDKYKIKYWLTDGTLLGLYRDNDFISHDRDTDIGIDFDSFNKESFFELKEIFNIDHVFGYVEDSLEIALIKDNVKTDLFFFYKKDNKYYHCAFSEWKENSYRRIDYTYDIFDIKETDFLGIKFNIPKNPLNFILTKYGEDWQIPDKRWKYDYSPKNHIKTNIWIDKKESEDKFNNWIYKIK